MHGVTVFNPSQLLQRFGNLKIGFSKAGNFKKNFCTITVDANVFIICRVFEPLLFRKVSIVGHRRPAEINSLVPLVQDDLYVVMVEELIDGSNFLDESRNAGVGIIEGSTQEVDL